MCSTMCVLACMHLTDLLSNWLQASPSGEGHHREATVLVALLPTQHFVALGSAHVGVCHNVAQQDARSYWQMVLLG